MLLSPTLLVLALVIVYPLLSAVHQSLFRAESGLDADGFVSDVESFVGLANYADLFVGESGRRFLNAFANTTFFTVTTVFLETVLGLCLALAMNRAFRGRSFLRASILVPWAVPTAVSGLLWRWIFQSDGIANTLLGSEILWTAEGNASRLAVIMSCQRLSVGSRIISGLPSRMAAIVPMASEWSVTATQSRGRESRTGWPDDAVTCSPRANRTASSGDSVAPLKPASTDQPVCTCSSPNSGRSG